MRLRKRYQEGGRTADLLAALERRKTTNELNQKIPERIAQPFSAPASTTRVAMQQPAYTSPEEAMLDQDAATYVNFAKLFGEPLTEEEANYLRETQELPSGAIESSYPILDFLSPVGDLKAMGEAEGGLEFAMAAGLAFAPGNLRDLKDYLPTFVRPQQINNLSKILDAVDDVGGSADELLAVNAPQIASMSPESRKELGEALQEITDQITGFPMFSNDEIVRLEETAKYLKSPNIQQASSAASKSGLPKQKIGDFNLEYGREGGRDGMVYRNKDNDDYISLIENAPNDYTLVALLEETKSPSQRGLLMAETIKQIPKGGRVRFGSVNDLSSDSYVFPISYIEKGKGKPDLSNVEFLKLNELGQTPQAFATAFKIEPRQVSIVDGNARGSAEEVAQIKSKIDEKLKSLGLPESKLDTRSEYDFSSKQNVEVSQILMPHFDMIKTIGKGEFKDGGNLRVIKMKSGGKLRAKKSY